MTELYTRTANSPLTDDEKLLLLETEWLVTNGLGGYASGTIIGAPTRVFHGYLIAALPSPKGRTMMLNQLVETLVFPNGREVTLNGFNKPAQNFDGTLYFSAFRLDHGLPVWTFEIDGLTIEKRVVLPHGQNTTYIIYRVASGEGSTTLRLRPAINFRGHEAPVDTPLQSYSVSFQERHFEITTGEEPPLRLTHLGDNARFEIETCQFRDVTYDVEHNRGYNWIGDLWSPGNFTAKLAPGCDIALVASTENWETMSALTPQQAWDAELDRKRRMLREAEPEARGGFGDELVWAADQFIFAPVGRQEDTARANAAGDEVRSVIAGYHWFTDWGRDTMISLEGLTMTTGRVVETSYILRTFAHYIKDGLIPNMFPEGKTEGLYHTADATLWFFHALHRYIHRTNDHQLLKQFLPKLLDIIGHHLRGTHFNIHVDPADGLLVQGQEGYQLTWMDAKVDDWVVTPRRGKAVEINALWYNALCLTRGWLRQFGRTDEANGLQVHAEKAKASFNARFWNPDTGYLFDVVDTPEGASDPVCRPNQLFSISLDHPVLDKSRWEAVVKVAKDRLLTPVGLRSLAPGEPDYKPRYDGDLRSRDAAYHQGTVWAWLIGPFIDAWLKVYPDDLRTARGFLSGFEKHTRGGCIGSISEVFDATEPFFPRGCCAQAWSVAEVLRCYVKSAGVAASVQEPAMATSSI